MSDFIKKFKLTSMEQIVQLLLPMLNMGKAVKFTVVGNSMYPVFRSNVENVTVVKADEVKKRDVILYKREDGSYILHRIVGKGKLGYKLCGDNQMVIEYPVKKEDVVAVVISFERNGKEIPVSRFWYKLYSFVWCLLIPLRPLGFKVAYKMKKIFKRSK